MATSRVRLEPYRISRRACIRTLTNLRTKTCKETRERYDRIHKPRWSLLQTESPSADLSSLAAIIVEIDCDWLIGLVGEVLAGMERGRSRSSFLRESQHRFVDQPVQ